MSVVRVKGENGTYLIEFQRHPSKGVNVFRGDPFDLGKIDAIAGEYQGKPPTGTVLPDRILDYIQTAIARSQDSPELKNKPIDVFIVDVPVTAKERTSSNRRRTIGGVLSMIGTVILAPTLSVKALSHIARKVNKDWVSPVFPLKMGRRTFLKIAGTGAGLVIVGEAISQSMLNQPASFRGKEGALRRTARKTSAALHGVAPNWVIRGRDAAMAQRLESVSNVLRQELGRKPTIAVLNVGPAHSALPELIKDPQKRRQALERFYERIEKIPPSHRERVHRIKFDPTAPKGKRFQRSEVPVPPLLTRKKIEMLRRKNPKGASRITLEQQKMTRRNAMIGRWKTKTRRGRRG